MPTKTDPLTTFAIGLELELFTCSHDACGISFALPTWYAKERRADHATWYCPNGHRRYFPGKSDEEKLRDQLQAAKKEVEYQRSLRQEADQNAKHFEARANGYKGQAAKLKKRAAAGTCAFCSRTFSNVADHVKTQHPSEHQAVLAGSDDGHR